MTTQALRKQVKKYIDKADDKSLRIVQAILEIEQQEDFWDTLPEHIKEDVRIAEKQSAKGLGKSTEQVMAKYSKWVTK